MSTTISLDGANLTLPTANDTSWDRSLNATVAAAVARLDKTPEVFNVKKYLATGDGVTNDQAAIQNAINACAAAGGGIVYFPPGTYRINTGLTVTSSGVRLVGSARQASTLTYYGSGAAITLGSTVTPIYRWGVEHLRVSDLGGSGTHGFKIEYAREGKMSNVEIRGVASVGFSTAGLYLAGTASDGNWSNRFNHVQIRLCGGYGIFVGRQSNAVVFSECHVTESGLDNVRVEAANGVRFSDCQFEQAVSGCEIRVAGVAVSTTVHSLVIAGCYFELKAATSSARAVIVNENGAFTNSVEELVVRDCYVWGTTAATYAFEFNNPNGHVFGSVDDCFGHGLVTALVRLTTGNDRMTVRGTRALTAFGTGSTLPIIDDNSGTGAGSSISNGLRGLDLTGQLRLPRYSGSPTSIIGQGSVWYATGADRIVYRDGASNTRHIQPCISGTTGNRPATPPAGFTYYDTTLGKPVFYTGAGWVDATGAGV